MPVSDEPLAAESTKAAALSAKASNGDKATVARANNLSSRSFSARRARSSSVFAYWPKPSRAARALSLSTDFHLVVIRKFSASRSRSFSARRPSRAGSPCKLGHKTDHPPAPPSHNHSASGITPSPTGPFFRRKYSLRLNPRSLPRPNPSTRGRPPFPERTQTRIRGLAQGAATVAAASPPSKTAPHRPNRRLTQHHQHTEYPQAAPTPASLQAASTNSARCAPKMPHPSAHHPFQSQNSSPNPFLVPTCQPSNPFITLHLWECGLGKAHRMRDGAPGAGSGRGGGGGGQSVSGCKKTAVGSSARRIHPRYTHDDSVVVNRQSYQRLSCRYTVFCNHV